MTIYTVLAPPEAGSAGPDRDRFVFIKEGFCWPAFFFAAIWLLFRRMWLVFILYLERRGYRFIGVAAGQRLAEAEFRFFSTWPGAAAEAKPAEPPKPAVLPPVATGEIVGLFPKPGGAS